MTEPAERPLRAGVIGVGMMGLHHVRVWDESVDGVSLVAVADPNAEAARSAVQARSARPFDDPDRMLAESGLDLVSVVAPTGLHVPVTLAALEAGAHVLVEKPIAATHDEAAEMIAAAASAGRMLTVGHIERFNPAILELKRRLEAGELGRIFQVSATRLGPFPARIRDVGVVVDLAPHDLDVFRFILDDEPVRVFAEAERRVHTDHEDLFTGTMRFSNGAIGLLNINWLTPIKQRLLSVTGERGMFVADYLTQELTFHADGESTPCPVEREEPLRVELREFAQAVRDGGPPPVDPRDAVIAVLLARRMVESALIGEAISGEALMRELS